MALYGGPMKTSPASVHFCANAEFSLNCVPGSKLVLYLEFSIKLCTDNLQSRNQGVSLDTLLSLQSQ